jgi:HEAT repeat protein
VSTKAVSDLIGLLKDKDGDMRIRAAEELVGVVDEAAVPALIDTLKDADTA